MARPVRGCLTPWSWQKGADETEVNISVPQQVGQTDASRGEVVADYNPDVDMNQRSQILRSKQSMKKRKTLMQNILK